MILIGQYDSPFVRRVAIAMRLYGLPFEHEPWSTFGDRDRIAEFNPLSRVPTLVLDDGDVVIESAAILDYLDEIAVGKPPLVAQKGIERRQALKICALSTGLADKAVSLLYEGLLRSEKSSVWVERCETQIARVLDVLESDLAEMISEMPISRRLVRFAFCARRIQASLMSRNIRHWLVWQLDAKRWHLSRRSFSLWCRHLHDTV